MRMHDALPYVVAAYAVTWTVLASYAVYLWRCGRRLKAEALRCE
jgi:hypothetical protein